MFRDDFVWGVASSSYQVEGTDANDGRGKTVWMHLRRQAGFSKIRMLIRPVIICIIIRKITR